MFSWVFTFWSFFRIFTFSAARFSAPRSCWIPWVWLAISSEKRNLMAVFTFIQELKHPEIITKANQQGMEGQPKWWVIFLEISSQVIPAIMAFFQLKWYIWGSLHITAAVREGEVLRSPDSRHGIDHKTESHHQWRRSCCDSCPPIGLHRRCRVPISRHIFRDLLLAGAIQSCPRRKVVSQIPTSNIQLPATFPGFTVFQQQNLMSHLEQLGKVSAEQLGWKVKSQQERFFPKED